MLAKKKLRWKELVKYGYAHPVGLSALSTMFALLTWSVAADADMPVIKRTLVEGSYAVTGNDFMDCQSGSSCSNNGSALVPVDVDNDPSTTVSSSAKLTLPSDAGVVSAYLIVTQNNSLGTPYDYPTKESDYAIKFKKDSGAYVTVQPEKVSGMGKQSYRARYDVTSYVTGTGMYTVADMQYAPPSARNVSSMWYLVVIYKQPGAPLRSVTEYGPMGESCYHNTVTATMEFTTPATGTPKGLLTVLGSDGHPGVTGESGKFGSLVLTNSENPPNNLGNSSVSDPNGPIPRNPSSYHVTESADIDLYDVSSALTNSQTNETLSFTCTGGDGVWWTGAVLSVDVVAPQVSVIKSVVEVGDDDGVIKLGDLLEYTITVKTEARENALDMILQDNLPPELTYEPGTLMITAGANQGALTDAAGDDQGEVSGQAITVRLGTGADASSGGELDIGESTTVKFRARFTKAPSNGNEIRNQAIVTFRGASTGASTTYNTASNPSTGTGPTTSPAEFCGNGTVFGNEACDDGNTTDGDGCNANCLFEDGYGPCTTDSQCAGGYCVSGTCSSNAAPVITSNGGQDTASVTVQENTSAVTTVTATDANSGDKLTYSISGGADQGSFSIDPNTGALTFNSPPDAENPTDANSDGKYEVTVKVCDDGTPVRCDTQTITVTVSNVGCASNADCSGTTPACDTSTDQCIACRSDSDCSGATPACNNNSGACVQCTASNTSQCTGNTMVCDTATSTCVQCTANDVSHCPASQPVCDTTSMSCVQCNADADCSGLTPTCNNHSCVCVPSGNEVCGNQVDENCDGQLDENCPDTDGDGIIDAIEEQIGTDPKDADSDDDGVLDGDEPDYATDTDGDGLINALDPDSDNDGLYDGTEMGKDCSGKATDTSKHHCIPDADPGTTTDPLDADSDNGGVSDGMEDPDLDGKIDSGETDPTDGHGGDDTTITDSDGDGLSDELENHLGTDPHDADSDDDGVLDGDEPNYADDTDGDGLINPLDPDSDNDGLYDGTELGKDCANPATDTSKHHCIEDADSGTTTSCVDADSDDGGVIDGSEDANLDGKLDSGEIDPTKGHGADDKNATDTDGDGLSDELERRLGTDPNDADSDDDGVPDGEEPNFADDTDGDGLINALDPDSDNDGLYDGTEMGRDCSNKATDTSKNHCIPDADPSTTTSPVDADTDDGGAIDGSEDANLNGKVDPGEQDPTAGHGADDKKLTDSDGDGLSDELEKFLGSDPNDADSDDDGVVDGQEPNFADDTDGDGLRNVGDEDSDNDGLFDGTELGLDCDDAATDKAKKHCTPDADPSTTTNPLLRDTDGGGVIDGSEDTNLNGKVDDNERDPSTGHEDDDKDVTDSDGDGLSDELEKFLGSDPNDADSDDDGVKDGDEPNFSSDTDGDGKRNVNDEDSDGDGLYDGTELGLGCDDPATDKNANHCIADADPETTTNPLVPDTDHGGIIDGVEDENHNGAKDQGETDPNDPSDDKPCKIDSDCGNETSGRVCAADHRCADGCRGTNGNGCPVGFHCTSTDETIGQCVIDHDGGAGGSAGAGGAGGAAGQPAGGSAGNEPAGGNAGSDLEPNDEAVIEGGGCDCGVPAGRSSTGGMGGLFLVGLGLAAGLVRRRRREQNR